MTNDSPSRFGGFFHAPGETANLKPSPQRPALRLTRVIIALVLGWTAIATSGCAERATAPELTYSPTESADLQKKIKEFEW